MKKVWEFFKMVWPFAKAFICIKEREEAEALFAWMTSVSEKSEAYSAGFGDAVFIEPDQSVVMPKFYYRLAKRLEETQEEAKVNEEVR